MTSRLGMFTTSLAVGLIGSAALAMSALSPQDAPPPPREEGRNTNAPRSEVPEELREQLTRYIRERAEGGASFEEIRDSLWQALPERFQNVARERMGRMRDGGGPQQGRPMQPDLVRPDRLGPSGPVAGPDAGPDAGPKARNGQADGAKKQKGKAQRKGQAGRRPGEMNDRRGEFDGRKGPARQGMSRDQMRGAMRDRFRDGFRDKLRDRVRDQVRDGVRDDAKAGRGPQGRRLQGQPMPGQGPRQLGMNEDLGRRGPGWRGQAPQFGPQAGPQAMGPGGRRPDADRPAQGSRRQGPGARGGEGGPADRPMPRRRPAN
jgi:hypothetical protein